MSKLVLRPSWKNYVPHYFLMFVIIALMILITVNFSPSEFWGNVVYSVGMLAILAVVGKVMLIRFDERFTIAEKEITMEHGIFNKSSVEVGVLQIRTIQVKQNIWQRMMNIGDLLIASSGTEGYEIIAHGVDAPYQLRDKIQELQGGKETQD